MTRFGRSFPIRIVQTRNPLNPPAVAFDDSATVFFDLQPIVTLEEHTTTDSATVYLDITNTGGECYSTFTAQNFGEGEATLRWSGDATLRWSGDENLRWTAVVSVGTEIEC